MKYEAKPTRTQRENYQANFERRTPYKNRPKI
jgi:hypothetical protein